MTNDRYIRHDSIQGVQIRISHTDELDASDKFYDETIPGFSVYRTTTIDEWQGKRTSDDGIVLHQPKIEL